MKLVKKTRVSSKKNYKTKDDSIKNKIKNLLDVDDKVRIKRKNVKDVIKNVSVIERSLKPVYQLKNEKGYFFRNELIFIGEIDNSKNK